MKQKLLNVFGLRVAALVALMCASVGLSTAWADTDDVLNQSFTGITGTSYSAFSGKTGTSGAVYAGNCAGGNSSIQLRSNNNNSGVVTTTSGGTAKKVTVTWNSNTTSGRTLNVYGKNSAYSAASELYNTSSQGTLIGTIVCGTSTELTISDEYAFIGFRSNSGAMYLDEVKITWGSAAVSSAVTTTTTINVPSNFNNDVYTSTTAGTLTATVRDDKDQTVVGATVTWSSSNSAVATVDDGGNVTLVSKGTTTITASYAGVKDEYKESYGEYVLTVVNNVPASQVTEETFVLAGQGYAYQEVVESLAGLAATLHFQKGSGTTDPAFYDPSIRLYNGNNLAVQSSGNNMTQIVLTFEGSSYAKMTLPSEQPGTLGALTSSAPFTMTWTGKSALVKFNVSGTSRLKSVQITYEVVSATQVKTPEISINDPEEPFLTTKTVSISCATAGATIHYTTDGSEPTSESATYSAPFVVNKTTMVKAIAVKTGMDDSNVGELNVKQETILNGLTELNAQTNTTKQDYYVQLTNAQVSYVYGNYGFLQDATAATYAYQAELVKNKVYNGLFKITFQLFSKLPEMTAIETVDGTITDATDDIEPELVTLPQLTENYNDYLCKMIRIEAATVSRALSEKSAGIDQYGITMALRQQGNATITKLEEENNVVNIIAFPALYNTTMQLYIFTDDQIEIETRTVAPLSFGQSTYEAEFSEGFTAPTLVNPEDLDELVWKSSNTDVAYVNVATGAVTLVDVGTTVISVSYGGDTDYLPTTVSYTLTVTNSALPAVTITSETTLNFTAEVTDEPITYQLTNFDSNTMTLTAEFFTDATATSATTCDWAYVNFDTEGTFFYAEENNGAERTAYVKLAIYAGTGQVYYSELITVTQAALDFAKLPFAFDGGKSELPYGLTQTGLGTDYSSSPKLRFDTTGDELVLKLKQDDTPPIFALEFDIKGNSFSDGTFTVLTSQDGNTWNTLATYTELGGTKTERLSVIDDSRYVKWVYTSKENGNVALGNIKAFFGYYRTGQSGPRAMLHQRQQCRRRNTL